MSQATPDSDVDRRLLAVVLTSALVALLGAYWASGKVRPTTSPGEALWLTNFALTSSTGRLVTREDLSNRFLVVNFVFTSCSLSCLDVSRNMARIQTLLAGQDDVRLVSFTVDPRSDTPSVLAKFGDRFGADTNRWLLLTGEKARVYGVIETSFLRRSDDPRWSGMPGGFMNADRIAVVDTRGQVRGFFDGMRSGTPVEVTNLIGQLRRHLHDS